MGFLRRYIKSTSFPGFVLFLILTIVNIYVTKGFLNGSYLNSFFAANAALICLAFGVSIVIIAGGIDLSIGAIICLCNVTMISLFGAHWSIPATLVLCIVMSSAMGALNGLLVAIFRTNPIMATFATQSIFSGLALWVRDIPGGSAPRALCEWFGIRVFGFIPMSVIVLLALMIVVLVIMKTPMGIRMYAIGNNEEKAYISGVRVTRIKFLTYTFSGFAAGIAAICYTAYTGGGDPTAPMTLTLSTIAVCVIGGISLTGGKGSFIGCLWGALFLQMIISIVLSLRIPTMTTDLVHGLIIFVGIAGTLAIFGRENRNKAQGRLSKEDKGRVV